MGDFDSFFGGFPIVGQMYDHASSLAFHTANKVYFIHSSTTGPVEDDDTSSSAEVTYASIAKYGEF